MKIRILEKLTETDGRLRCYLLKEPMISDILRALKGKYSSLPQPPCCRDSTGRAKGKRASI